MGCPASSLNLSVPVINLKASVTLLPYITFAGKHFHLRVVGVMVGHEGKHVAVRVPVFGKRTVVADTPFLPI